MIFFNAGRLLSYQSFLLLLSKHWLYGCCLVALMAMSDNSLAATSNLNTLHWHFASDPSVLNAPLPYNDGRYHIAYPQTGSHLRRIGGDSQQGLIQFLNELQVPLLLTNTVHPNHEPIAGLALGWALKPESRQIIFKLDRNAQWSDGQPLTGADFVFSHAQLNKEEYPWLLSLRSMDDLLLFQLADFAWEDQQPLPWIWQQLMSFKPLAAHFHHQYRDWPNELDDRYEPTSGPYHIQDWQADEQIVLLRTENWWAKNRLFFQYRFAFKRITLSLLESSDEALRLLRYGDIDAMPIRTTDTNSQAKITALQTEKNIHRQIFRGAEAMIQSGVVIRNDRLQYLSGWLLPEHATSAVQPKTLRIGYYLPLSNELLALVTQATRNGVNLIPLAHPVERLRQWTQEPSTMQLDMIWLTSNQIEKVPLHSDLKLIAPPAYKESSVLFWPWLQRPHPLPISTQAKTFYAWNLHDGGLLWLNPEERSRVLLYSAPNQATRIHTIEVGNATPIMHH